MAAAQPIVLSGTYTVAAGANQLPPASSYAMNFAIVTDQGPARLYWSDGATWSKAQNKVYTYSGTTDGSGNWSVTYPSAFATVPNVQPVLNNPTDLMVFKLTVSTVNGFTINVVQRAKLTVLGIDLLGFLATAVSGQSLTALVVET